MQGRLTGTRQSDSSQDSNRKGQDLNSQGRSLNKKSPNSLR